MNRLPLLFSTLVLSLSLSGAARAATLQVGPDGAQPGDVLTVTVFPAAGEIISALSMKAFDTPLVKFYSRTDGSARGFLGYPFDRRGGTFTLGARVRVTRDGRTFDQVLSTRFVGRDRVLSDAAHSHEGVHRQQMNEKAAFAREKARVQKTMQTSHPAPLWSGKWVTPTPGTSSSAYGRRRYVMAAGGVSTMALMSKRQAVPPCVWPTAGASCFRNICRFCAATASWSIMAATSSRSTCTYRNGWWQSAECEQRPTHRARRRHGFATGPHLHWEVRVGWEPVDPNRVVARGLSF
jgi:murein DD-endopeptidase MepM/ murein hydrolase activator NlpD